MKKEAKDAGLNPYSNGIYSMRVITATCSTLLSSGLNPYSNGIYSMRLIFIKAL